MSLRIKWKKIQINFGFFFIIITILLQVATNILFKSAAMSLKSFNLVNILTNELYILSIFFYFLRSIVWQLVLKDFDLNFAFLLRSSSFAILLFVSHYYFKEEISIFNIIGVFMIMIGVAITGLSHNK